MRGLCVLLVAALLSGCTTLTVSVTPTPPRLPEGCVAVKRTNNANSVYVKVGESCSGSKLRIKVKEQWGYLGAEGTVVESVHVQNLDGLLIDLQLPKKTDWHVVYANPQ